MSCTCCVEGDKVAVVVVCAKAAVPSARAANAAKTGLSMGNPFASCPAKGCAASYIPKLEPEQPLRVAAVDLRPVLRAERDVLHPFHARGIEHEGIVDREEDPVGAHLHHGAQQRRGGEVAAGGNPEMLTERIAERRAAIALARE